MADPYHPVPFANFSKAKHVIFSGSSDTNNRRVPTPEFPLATKRKHHCCEEVEGVKQRMEAYEIRWERHKQAVIDMDYIQKDNYNGLRTEIFRLKSLIKTILEFDERMLASVKSNNISLFQG